MAEIIIIDSAAIVPVASIAQLGQIANHHAKQDVFKRELNKKTANTRISYRTDLKTWMQYLVAAGADVQACDFYNEPACWTGVTHGLVLGFVEWMKKRGFAIASINRKLSCVRMFCAMAGQAKVIDTGELALIQTVRTIRHSEGMEVNKDRSQARIDRPQAKKSKSVELSADDARLLKDQPDTPQGRRDALLMCLLLDHGLRSGEAAALMVSNFNLKTGIMTFWREKVKKQQKHKLTADTLTALRNYIDSGDCVGSGPLLRSSLKSGALGKAGMQAHAITVRVKHLGEDKLLMDELSAHDCRHYWATSAVKGKTDPFALRQAGGWSSMQTVQRYVSENEIANEGVRLGE